MSRLRNGEAAKLKGMVVSSGSCVKTLQEKLDLAERILKLGDVNGRVRILEWASVYGVGVCVPSSSWAT